VNRLPVLGIVGCISLRHRVRRARKYQTAGEQTDLRLDFHLILSGYVDRRCG
jgi:hypothetical protein